MTETTAWRGGGGGPPRTGSSTPTMRMWKESGGGGCAGSAAAPTRRTGTGSRWSGPGGCGASSRCRSARRPVSVGRDSQAALGSKAGGDGTPGGGDRGIAYAGAGEKGRRQVVRAGADQPGHEAIPGARRAQAPAIVTRMGRDRLAGSVRRRRNLAGPFHSSGKRRIERGAGGRRPTEAARVSANPEPEDRQTEPPNQPAAGGSPPLGRERAGCEDGAEPCDIATRCRCP